MGLLGEIWSGMLGVILFIVAFIILGGGISFILFSGGNWLMVIIGIIMIIVGIGITIASRHRIHGR